MKWIKSILFFVCIGLAPICHTVSAMSEESLKEDIATGKITLQSLSNDIFKNLPEYQHLPSDCHNKNFENEYIKEYKSVISLAYFKEAFEIITKEYKTHLFEQDDLWFTKSKNVPYEQKIDFDNDLPIVVIGDIHGNIHSLIRDLWVLFTLGLIDNNLKLKCKLIFLGDYVDRAPFGIEVLFLVVLLKIINFNLVELHAGNHEEKWMNSLDPFHGGFVIELLHRFDLKKTEVEQLFKNYISPFYACLPYNSYMKLDEDYVISFRHAGITQGYYQTEEFLKASDKKFQYLGEARKISPIENVYTYKNDYEGYIRNKFEVSPSSQYEFDIKATEEYLAENNLKHIIRGHEHYIFDTGCVILDSKKNKHKPWDEIIKEDDRSNNTFEVQDEHLVITTYSCPSLRKLYRADSLIAYSVYDAFLIFRCNKENKILFAQVTQTELAKERYGKYCSIDKDGQYRWTNDSVDEPVGMDVDNPVGIDVENPFSVRCNRDTKEIIDFIIQNMENVKIPATKIVFGGGENSVFAPESFLCN